MKSLILHPGDLIQWHALVNEAQASTRIILSEHTESYLVFLLLRFSRKVSMVESILALDFLDCLHKPRSMQLDALKDIGDKSLLFSGLFPGIARKQMVSVEYFSSLGKSAYLTVGELEHADSSRLYLDLSSQFYRLQQILQAMRGEFIQYKLQDNGILSDGDLSSI